MVFSWVNGDSTPLDTLIQGYVAMMTIVIGLYVWTEKGRELISLKKILKKEEIDSSDINDKISEQSNYRDGDVN